MIGPHLCARFNRLVSNGKRKRHVRQCPTCRGAALLEMERRGLVKRTAQVHPVVED